MVKLLVARKDVEVRMAVRRCLTPFNTGVRVVVNILVARDDVEVHSIYQHGHLPPPYAPLVRGHEAGVKLLQ